MTVAETKVPVELKTASELDRMRQAGRVARDILKVLSQAVASGISAAAIDDLARSEIFRRKVQPAFLNYRGFPAVVCVSVNKEVVHGIPRPETVFREGDLVSLDFGIILDGFYADTAVTVPVGQVDSQSRRLLEVTREALDRGIAQMVADRRLGDVSWAVQSHVEAHGMSVVREFVGHGIGRKLHEEPAVPNYGKPHTGLRLRPGMVLAIEPMVNLGGPEVRILPDGWTAVTADGKKSAHFEHTVAVTENGPEILT